METRIILGVPSYDGKITSELATFFFEAGSYHEWQTEIVRVNHTPTDIARNQIVARAKERKASAVVMVDSDCIAPKYAYWQLVNKVLDEECVAALPYCAKGGQICVGELSPGAREVENLQGWYAVDNVGTHLIAYNCKVFDRIKQPYYQYEYNKTHTGLMGHAEDTTLHRKLRNAGVPIYVNWSSWAGHIVSKVIEKPRALTETEKAIVMAGL